jgi:hypothetical protein
MNSILMPFHTHVIPILMSFHFAFSILSFHLFFKFLTSYLKQICFFPLVSFLHCLLIFDLFHVQSLFFSAN